MPRRTPNGPWAETFLGGGKDRLLSGLHPAVRRIRAATLRAIAEVENATGGERARRLGISPASASEHAAVLRDADLIQSLRNTIRHTLTPLGAEFLDGRARRTGP
ncbi:hypothetical protein [Streptomyces aurantiacus]|uniref:hypothetical protein n=1 Tax=Streptomyces aurantiacus TaxID=47760 RepID=UPI0035204308